MKDIYQQVTDTILKQLKDGVAAWIKPWKERKGSFKLPVNETTGKAYNGVNIPLLWGSAEEQGFLSNKWASFNQWMSKKEFVKKGEKGTMIVYYDTFNRPDKDNEDEIKRIPFIKASYVFNSCQLKSYDPEKEASNEPAPLVNRIEKVDHFIKGTGAIIEHIGNEACYIPSIDKIRMPEITSFLDLKDCTKEEAYYSVLFHELTHLTGHESRLNRGIKNGFGSEKYAKEELVAELGSAFLGAEFEIEKAPLENHAAYIKGWSKKLEDEPKTFITAASQASKAVTYLHEHQIH